ncbi:carbohydrate kinase family protein [Bythopirellula goksoeyrii]|uniref:2-dehydro-3-deoxygluconokinase n=1 Tax=Bythopirellula goksoeyrii TaxID=1400387 RepID=A0A5B9Q384_9BACT|nr:carbohydrate kinase family protein [Bythopirellula goksoeyrii]QEG33454.1 2-dehydro-3-deoxygluconokinase [Bythopirellula goksoeyrii]
MKASETNAPEVVVAGHVCLDIIPSFLQDTSVASSQIEPGKLKVMGPAACVTGGCVANTGLTLHQLGVRTSLMGKIGDDPFGDQILGIVKKADASLAESMIVAPGEHSSYSIVISPPGVDRSFLHFPGANDTFSAGDVPLEQLNQCKLFHFGYPPLMKCFWNDGGSAMAGLLRSVKEKGAMTSLDMAMPDPTAPAGKIDWKPWLEQVLPHVDLFMPSLDEILFMLDPKQYTNKTPGEVFDSDLLSKTADQLISLGAGIVVLKLGTHGLYLKSSSAVDRISRGFYPGKNSLEAWVGRELYTPCFEVPVVSTNGAGDRTIAGFLAAVVQDASPTEALQMAVGVGATSVAASDFSEADFSWESIKRRVDAGWNHQPVENAVREDFRSDESGCWRGKQDKATVRKLTTAT